jgi:hypothetical protein
MSEVWKNNSELVDELCDSDQHLAGLQKKLYSARSANNKKQILASEIEIQIYLDCKDSIEQARWADIS